MSPETISWLMAGVPSKGGVHSTVFFNFSSVSTLLSVNMTDSALFEAERYPFLLHQFVAPAD
jgi:hypothetical protein